MGGRRSSRDICPTNWTDISASLLLFSAFSWWTITIMSSDRVGMDNDIALPWNQSPCFFREAIFLLTLIFPFLVPFMLPALNYTKPPLCQYFVANGREPILKVCPIAMEKGMQWLHILQHDPACIKYVLAIYYFHTVISGCLPLTTKYWIRCVLCDSAQGA